jgi:hypothetical protein
VTPRCHYPRWIEGSRHPTVASPGLYWKRCPSPSFLDSPQLRLRAWKEDGETASGRSGEWNSVLNEPVGSQSARSRAYAVSHSQSNSTSQSEILANWLGLHPDCVIYMVLSLVMGALNCRKKVGEKAFPRYWRAKISRYFPPSELPNNHFLSTSQHLHELSINSQSDYCIRILVINIPKRKSTQPPARQPALHLRLGNFFRHEISTISSNS